jgi:ABC-type transport system involved in multi-copper enzyme maturation permease subunit
MAQPGEDTPPPPAPGEAADHPQPHSRSGRQGRPGPGARLAGVWTALARATVDNPVLVKEFRTRMRGTRAYWILLGYTLLLSGVVAIMYFSYEARAGEQADATTGVAGTQGARDLGRAIYYFAFIAQAIMVALITPAITAGSVTIEREQRSYELLVTTPLRPADVIRGKLSAAVSFVVLLLTASLPLVSLSFLVGGVSPAEIFFSYLVIALTVFLYGAIGIFWSATLRTTATATVVTYITVLSLFVLTMVPWMFTSGPTSAATPDIPFQSLNPIAATFRAVQPEHFFTTQLPSWIASSLINLLLALLITNAAMSRLEHFDPPRPLWTRLYSTLLWCAFGLFFFAPMLLGGTPPSGINPGFITDLTFRLLTTMLVLVCVVTPIFNTGDLVVRRGESPLRRYLSGFLPHRMFANDLSCGFPLMVGWAVFLFALVPFGIALAGKGKQFHPYALYVPGVFLCLAVATGLAGVGNYLSVTLPSRWAACVLTYLVAVVLMLLPYFTLFPWREMTVRPTKPQALWQVLYLAPGQGLWELANPTAFWTENPKMVFGTAIPIWVVTGSIYLALGLFGFVFTAVRIQREGRNLQRRMEAAEAALTGAAA